MISHWMVRPMSSEILDNTRRTSIICLSRALAVKKNPLILSNAKFEDWVRRTIDIEIAFFDGAEAFEPYLLAIANRGFLYVNEVNPQVDH